MSAVLAPSPSSRSDTPQQVLQAVFGHKVFRGEQAQIVEHVSGGGDALVLMPTGGGKSVCYQVPALVRHRAGRGVTVVVSPLIALMQDQVAALREAENAVTNETTKGALGRLIKKLEGVK